MLKFISKMLSENGGVSSMRTMSFLSLFLGGAVAFYGIHENKELTGLAMLVGVFVGSSFGGKVAQKFAEVKSETDNAENSN